MGDKSIEGNMLIGNIDSCTFSLILSCLLICKFFQDEIFYFFRNGIFLVNF